MKPFYSSEKVTFFTVHPDYVEIRVIHRLFWGLVSFMTVKKSNNKLA